MALKDLFFSIIARDKTGGAFDSVRRNLRDTEGAAASLSDRMTRAGRGMRNMGAAGSVASAGIIAAFRGSVQAYDLQSRAEAKVAQAIKSTGGAAGFTAKELTKQASALQSLTRFGDEDILNNVTAQLLTFKEISGDVFMDAQTAALDLSTVLDGDLKSASIMLGKALNDPAVGLSAMSRAGVTFTEAQKVMVKDMVSAGDLMGAQRLILDEIASAYGGQAEAARLAGAGVLDAWSNVWGDVKEVVGGVLLDVLRVIVPPLESAAKAFQNLSPSVQRAIVLGGAFAAVLPPIIAAAGVLVIGLAAVSAPVLAVAAGFAAATTALVAFWPQIKSAGVWIADSIGAIPGHVTAMVSAVKEALIGKLTDVLEKVGAKVEWVERKFFWLYDKVVGNSWVPDLVDEIGQSFALLKGNMVDPTGAAVDQTEGAFSGLFGDIKGGFRQLAIDGELTWNSFLDTLLDAGKRWSDRIIGDVFDKTVSGAMDALAGLGGSMFSGGGGGSGAGLGGLLGGIGSALGGLIGLDTGGSFTVGGRGGMDRNVASLRLSRDEEVHVTRPGRGGGAGQTTINVTIQTPDPQSFAASRAQIGRQIGAAVAAGQRAG
ncbi:tail tape measure [Dinoroseobacter phage vB_DshS-R4C]|nr:tail tape measure [Dinoroseobacter phage vB_DshS-R4C]